MMICKSTPGSRSELSRPAVFSHLLQNAFSVSNYHLQNLWMASFHGSGPITIRGQFNDIKSKGNYIVYDSRSYCDNDPNPHNMIHMDEHDHIERFRE